jgi:hypothetical protein
MTSMPFASVKVGVAAASKYKWVGLSSSASELGQVSQVFEWEDEAGEMRGHNYINDGTGVRISNHRP